MSSRPSGFVALDLGRGCGSSPMHACQLMWPNGVRVYNSMVLLGWRRDSRFLPSLLGATIWDYLWINHKVRKKRKIVPSTGQDNREVRKWPDSCGLDSHLFALIYLPEAVRGLIEASGLVVGAGHFPGCGRMSQKLQVPPAELESSCTGAGREEEGWMKHRRKRNGRWQEDKIPPHGKGK